MYCSGLVMRFKNSSFFVSNRDHNSSRGFGLVELMVSISIMTLVSTVILVKNRSFNNALLLRNQAYEIAFTLRQAQLMAVSGTKESSAINNIYGVHLNTSAATNRQYLMFRDDQGGAHWYDAGSDQIIGTVDLIDSNYVISDITAANGTSLGSTLSVTFKRPNFDAIFRTASGVSYTGPVNLVITPKNTNGYSSAAAIPSRRVEITGTGQITVK